MRIGLIGIVQEEMQRDVQGALAKIAACGYEGIETAKASLDKMHITPEAFKKHVDDAGLKVSVLHMTKYTYDESQLDVAHMVGCPNISMSYGPVESERQILEDAERYENIGGECAKRGLTLSYHNHNHEFKMFNGKTAFDLLMENTSPQSLKALIDVGWALFAGVDPAELIRKYADRCVVIHAKDYVTPDTHDASDETRKNVTFTEVGAGKLDLPSVLNAARDGDVQWVDVEQDRPHNLPPWESIKVSFDNIKNTLAAL